MNDFEQSYDVICVGAGLVGRLLAVGLSQKGLKVASLDNKLFDIEKVDLSDRRTISISFGSKKIFQELGLWEKINPHAQPIEQIRVLEGGSPWTLDYDAEDLGSNPMGYIVENKFILQALHEADTHLMDHQTSKSGKIDTFAPVQIQSVHRSDFGVKVELLSGEILKAPIIIAVDGANSFLRSQTNICVSTKQYNQKAMVTHICHELPHENTAFELFFKDGPLAILPLLIDNSGPSPKYRSGIVWCKNKDFDFNLLDNDQLAASLYEIFPFLGKISIESKRWVYPLSRMKVSSMIDTRFALAGDAGHQMHPIAGQGVNLGWRDAKSLISILGVAKNQGIDLGSTFLLKQYDDERRFDRLSLLWFTDSINRLYQNESKTLRFVRNASFAALNYSKPVKRAFMRRAMGLF